MSKVSVKTCSSCPLFYYDYGICQHPAQLGGYLCTWDTTERVPFYPNFSRHISCPLVQHPITIVADS